MDAAQSNTSLKGIRTATDKERANLAEMSPMESNKAQSWYSGPEKVASSHQSLPDPVYRLPNEILSLIFSSSLETHMVSAACDVQSKWWTSPWFLGADSTELIGYAHVARFSRRRNQLRELEGHPAGLVFGSPYASPWSLTSVCKHWREVAISMPILWTNIQLYFHGDEPKAWIEAILCRLVISFQRSKPLGLDITLVSSSQEISFISDILILLQKESHRWENLAMYISSHSSRVMMENWMAGLEHLPKLRSIASSCNLAGFFQNSHVPLLETWYDFTDTAFHASQSNIPQLCHVGTCIKWQYYRATARLYSQITWLSEFSNLLTLQVILDAHGDALARAGSALEFPRLISLTFGVSPSSCHFQHRMVNYFITPVLKCLRFMSFNNLSDVSSLISLIERSSCAITSLFLHQAALTSLQLHSILDIVPQLETLLIDFFITLHTASSVGCVHESVLRRIFNDGKQATEEPKCSELYDITLLNTIEMDFDLILNLVTLGHSAGVSQRRNKVTTSLCGLHHESRQEEICLIFKNTGCEITLKPWDLIYLEDSSWFEGTESEAAFTSDHSDSNSEWDLESSDQSDEEKPEDVEVNPLAHWFVEADLDSEDAADDSYEGDSESSESSDRSSRNTSWSP